MKKILLLGVGALLLGLVMVAVVGMYKFNYLASLPEYDADGNLVTEDETEQITSTEPDLSATTTDLAGRTALPPECILLEDFTDPSDLTWRAVNDGVMGGLSEGAVVIEDTTLVHSGTINTNGGGFSYAGARLLDDVLVGFSRLEVRLNTFGRQYAVNFSDARYRSISHYAPIPLWPEGGWQEATIEFADTTPTFFGRRANSEPFAAQFIDELNFILSDGIDGPFRLEIDWIRLCR